MTQVETDAGGMATGLVYSRDGRTRRQRARHVVVAGYSIETPRLLLASATSQHPQGLANSSGLVGKCLMVHSNEAVWGKMDEEIRWYKGPPGMAVTEHWNYEDAGKDFHGGYCFLSQGPLPTDWAQSLATKRGLWGVRLRREMGDYIYQAGLKIVGEIEPRGQNRVELANETDHFGVPIPRVTFARSENDRKLAEYAVNSMRHTLEAAGGRDLWSESGTAHLMGGCRMGDNPATSVVDSNGRAWDIPNLWVCDGSLFPTGGGVNPSLTIQANAVRIAGAIRRLAAHGEL